MLNTLPKQLQKLLPIPTLSMLLGYFSYHNTALLTIGAYTALGISLIVLILKPDQLKILKVIYQNNKTVIMTALVYIGYLIISAFFFSYKNLYQTTLDELYTALRYQVIFLIILIAFKREWVKRYLLFSFIITLSALCFIMPIKSYFFPLILENGTFESLFMAFRYGYLYPITILYPFLLATLLIWHQRLYQFFVLLLSIASFTIVLLSGGRGAFITIFTELMLFIGIYAYYKKFNLHKMLAVYVIVVSIIVGALTLGYQFNPLVRGKIVQSASNHNFTSGRTEMITSRFPVFIKNSSIIYGTGYGNHIYQKFLEDHKAPKVVGFYTTRKSGETIYHYWHDEPQFLAVFYESGIIGLVLFTIFLFSFLTVCIQYTSGRNIVGTILIGIFLSIIGNTFILGISDHTSINNLFLCFVIFLVVTAIKASENQTQ